MPSSVLCIVFVKFKDLAFAIGKYHKIVVPPLSASRTCCDVVLVKTRADTLDALKLYCQFKLKRKRYVVILKVAFLSRIYRCCANGMQVIKISLFLTLPF